MIYSKVRVEFSEESSPGVFNLIAKESGTQGENKVGVDVAEAVRACPRPLLVFAQAIEYIMENRLDKSETPALLKAARDYIKQWREFDDAVDRGVDIRTIEWPGAGKAGT